MKIEATQGACGAMVGGLNLAEPLAEDTIRAVRKAWIEHHVLAFPDQQLSDPDLVRITRYFGDLGDDPYFESIAPENPVVALTRRADETSPVFAETWHSDWSFMEKPPIGTCLYSLTIPPVGGDTSFINQEKALAEMPADLRTRIEGRTALHTAALAYAPDGTYGEREEGSDRSMKIRYCESARDVHPHPFILCHPESGRETLFGCFGYIVGVEGMENEEATELIRDIYLWQTREAFQYTHRWQENMLVLWDNRSVLHKANGGYDGYDRELHRTTIGPDESLYLAA
jgi:taurine dioxygenase